MSVIDIVLYLFSGILYGVCRYRPNAQSPLKTALLILCAVVLGLTFYGVGYDGAVFYISNNLTYSFHMLITIGVCLIVMILLVMYKASRMPIYYYQIMILTIVGTYVASGDNIVSLFLGITLSMIGLYSKIKQFGTDKNIICQAYRNGIKMGFLLMAVGVGIMVIFSNFSIQYTELNTLVKTQNSIELYMGSVLVFAGIMGIIGVLPFSTALLNVHRIFEQPIVLVNRFLISTALFLVLGNFIISVYADSNDSFWQFVFIGIGILSMCVSIIGSVLQYSIRRLYGYVALGHIGFIAIILSKEQPNSIFLAIQYTAGYVFSYSAFWAFARSVFVGKDQLERIQDLSVLHCAKPYYTFGFVISAMCFAGFPPLSVFWGKILVLSHSEYWNQPLFEVLVILVFIQGAWALRFMYFAYIYSNTNRPQVVYTHNASSLTGIMRIILTALAILYVYVFI